MDPPTSPGIDTQFSRARLKDIAAWIRDELDQLVARDGPDSLRPDDVLTLHDIFVALRKSSTITAMDLRSSGIHNAVKLISGVATRWPARLCDECDKIISTWTARFGEFSELHPFLHGRGGRLEGIGNSTEYSRQALLGRWSKLAAEKIDPKVSHQQGNLGFRAGAWWINPLFAHHAGIIGVESIDGGTTFDDHGAYAIVLKDTSEASATPEESLRHRISISDKGKFRLTAATPRSREPVRVLRCHNINSIWGPKAGIRYEGLYVVKGWSIHTARSDDAVGRQWKRGDILYEVELERNDPVPLAEVLKHPTNTEFDDYLEYGRLREQHRESKRQSLVGNTVKFVPHLVVKDAPRIRPALATIPSGDSVKSITGGLSSSSLNSLTFNRSALDQRRRGSRSKIFEEDEAVSPGTVSSRSGYPFTPDHSRTSGTSVQYSSRALTEESGKDFDNKQARASKNNSIHTSMSDMMEITPWMDREPSVDVPSPSTGRSLSQQNTGVLDTTSSTGDKPLPKSIAIDSSSHALTYTQREAKKWDWTGIKSISQHTRPGSPNKTSSLKFPHARSRHLNTNSLRLGPTPSISSAQSSQNSQHHSLGARVSDLRLVSPPSTHSESNRSVQSHDAITKAKNTRPGPIRSISTEQPSQLAVFNNSNIRASNSEFVFARSKSSEQFYQSARSQDPHAGPMNEGGDSTNEYSDYLPIRGAGASIDPIPSAQEWGRQISIDCPTEKKRTDSPVLSRPTTPTVRPKSPLNLSRRNSRRSSLESKSSGDGQVRFSDPFGDYGSREVVRRSSSGVAPDVVV